MSLIIDYEPHPKQMIVHQSQVKYRAILTGVGFGKTAWLVNEALKQSVKPSLYAVAAPTYPLLKNTTMREFFKFCPQEIISEYRVGDRIVKLVNGCEFIFIAGDDEKQIDRARGLTLGGAFLDEVTLFPYYFWQIIIGRIRDPNGTLRIQAVGTPKGHNWTKKIFVDKVNPMNGDLLPNPQDYAWFTGTTLDNPHTPEEYKQSLLNTYSGSFREQEIFGKFMSHEGLVYTQFSRDIHVQKIKKKWKEIYVFVDWGYHNPSVLLMAGIDAMGNMHIFKEFYEKRVMPEDFKKIAKEWNDEYNVTAFITDPSEPGLMAEFGRGGMRTIGGKNAVMEGISEVANWLEQKRITVDPACVNTIIEFEQYSFKKTPEGRAIKEEPEKIFDHAMDALRYGVMHFKKKDKVELLDVKNLF